jgi:hypothetical protein
MNEWWRPIYAAELAAYKATVATGKVFYATGVFTWKFMKGTV